MRKNKRKPILWAIGIGALTGLLTTMIIAAIAAMLIAGGKTGEETIVYFAVASLIVGSFAGALSTVSICTEKRILASVCSGGANISIWLIANILLFDGRFENLLVTALLVLGGSVAAGLVGRDRRRNRIKKRKMHPRTL